MLFLLAIGLLLMAGGWILVRKTGADDIPGFIQKATETWGTRYDNVVFFLLLLHLPWLAGLWLVVAMARRFLGKQDR